MELSDLRLIWDLLPYTANDKRPKHEPPLPNARAKHEPPPSLQHAGHPARTGSALTRRRREGHVHRSLRQRSLLRATAQQLAGHPRRQCEIGREPL
eukprot:7235156-Prymnesium_polylepis.1